MINYYTLYIIILAYCGFSGCEQQQPPRWPPGQGREIDRPDTSAGVERPDVMDEARADSTLRIFPGPFEVVQAHLVAFHREVSDRRGPSGTFDGIQDTTTWAYVDAFYTAALAGSGLTRDSTFDRNYETPMTGHGYGGATTYGPRQPYAHSRFAVWRYDAPWGGDDLVFSVILTVVYSGQPGKSYRFMSVTEPWPTHL